MRKGPDSLLLLVRDGGHDPFGGALYVFGAERVKIVWWDSSGVNYLGLPLTNESTLNNAFHAISA